MSTQMNGRDRRRRHRSLLRRDGPVCAYCGRPGGTGLPFSRLTIDHVRPRSKGGTNDLGNLVLACKLCNRRKADRLDWVVAA